MDQTDGHHVEVPVTDHAASRGNAILALTLLSVDVPAMLELPGLSEVMANCQMA